MRRKKGFTLVELLAVIVILAIILAIAVPTISTLIANQKKSAFTAGVKMLLKGVDYDILMNGAIPTTYGAESFGGNSADYTIDELFLADGVVNITVVGTAGGQFAGCNTGTTKGNPLPTTFTTTSVAC